MNNFNYRRKTEIIFGKDQLSQLGDQIKKNGGSRILLAYGMNSIKKTGLYDRVVSELNKAGLFFVELAGIKANPEVDTARLGAKMINEHNLDFVLAVGGGSVIDNAKHMIISQAANEDVWELIINQEKIAKAVDLVGLGTILTVSATGSEMNAGGVITNPETVEKLSMGHEDAVPLFSFLDPTSLETLPTQHRIAGVCDTMSHLLELYFTSHTDEGLTDRMNEAIMANTIAYATTYIKDNKDYKANAQIMISATYGLNGVTGLGKGGDWNTHSIEHELSATHDFTHGIGLALIHPYTLETYLNADLKNNQSLIKFVNLGKNVFKLNGSDLEIAKGCVEKIHELFAAWIDHKKLKDYGIEFDPTIWVDQLVNNHRIYGGYYKLNYDELLNIYKNIL